MDYNEIARTIGVFKQNAELIELRTVGKKMISGYFKDFDNLMKQLKKHENETFYFIMNSIRDECYSRSQNEILVYAPKESTKDVDIERREWLLIDCDPKRTSGVSATDDEKEYAIIASRDIFRFLKNNGFTDPIVADSGNGIHLLYKISMSNSDENKTLIQSTLKALDMLFTNETVDIDTSVYNAARLTKLYGTMARKGTHTPERPHRMSKILYIPKNITVNSKEVIKKIANKMPSPQQRRGSYNNKFNISDFLSNHGVNIVKSLPISGGTKHLVDCVFDSSHKSPDAAIFEYDNGALGYHCFHNSCADKEWRDVRLLFDPNAYDDVYIPPFTSKKIQQYSLPKYSQPHTGESRYVDITDIKEIDMSQIVSVPSGINILDKKIGGFVKGRLTVWSGANGSGKSILVSQTALDAINNGYSVAMFSGELTNQDTRRWLFLQAAGKEYNYESDMENWYFTKREAAEKISKWLKGKLFIYNNDYGTEIQSVISDTLTHIETYKPDVIIIDNLMSLDVSKMQGDKYDKQAIIAKELANIAKKCNVHIHFVCHPKKQNAFLRKNDISGSADITNAAHNVIMVHRVNNDFKNNAIEYLGKKAHEFEKYTNVIEIMKNRDLGVVDYLIGLYHEKESKRLYNFQNESKHYKWNDFKTQETFSHTQDELPFM